jgi:molybdopterin synthase catalytic subunit
MKLRIEFVASPIQSPASEYASRETGACLEFLGIVRESEEGAAIPGLHYEAYEPMARQQLERIVAELAGVNPCDEVIFVHRLGFVPVGEASLLVRITSRHRRAALAVMDELINRLKAEVPIWKRATA